MGLTMAKKMKPITFGPIQGAHAPARRTPTSTSFTIPPSTFAHHGVEPAPRELTNNEVRTMWAKYPDVSFADFCQAEQEA